MAESSSAVYRFYYYLNYELNDPRIEGLPLLKSPFTMIASLIAYNYFCLSLGPWLMKNRQPFQLRKSMIVFNIFQIIINSFLFYKALALGWFGYFNYFCAEIDFRDTERNRQIVQTCYLYFMIKVSDTIDTLFMVLRKKNNHISFLHLYHHTGMIIMTWLNAKYLPVGHHTCLGLYNSFVHVIMYSYYLLCSINPDKKYLAFKKLTTQIQMIQFLVIFTHLAITLFVPNCQYPRWVLLALLPNNAFMFFLFYDFYRKTYMVKKRETVNGIKNSSNLEKSE